MPYFSSFDGTELFYREEGDGPPVILLHGFSSSTELNWADPGIWLALVAGGMRVFGLDARGHGRSSKPHDPASYEGDAMARDLSALIDHLGLESFDLVAYSMGAVTALYFATAHTTSLRRLVLGGIGGDPAGWSASADGRPTEEAELWLSGLEAVNGDDVQDLAAQRARRGFEARGNDLLAMAALLRATRIRLSRDIKLSLITAPTLVLCGDRDADPKPFADSLIRGQAVVLEGDHESVVFNPLMAKAIVGFVTDPKLTERGEGDVGQTCIE